MYIVVVHTRRDLVPTLFRLLGGYMAKQIFADSEIVLAYREMKLSRFMLFSYLLGFACNQILW
jgi:hypothetical protein